MDRITPLTAFGAATDEGKTKAAIEPLITGAGGLVKLSDILIPHPWKPVAGVSVRYQNIIDDLHFTNRPLLDSYFHYLAIRENLQFDFGTYSWTAAPVLMIGDIPYAASAMQEVREQIRAAAAGSAIYYISAAAGAAAAPAVPAGVKIKVPPVIPGFPIESFKMTDVSKFVTHDFYKTWDNGAAKSDSPYGDSVSDLVKLLGPYCAYCEVNIKTQIDVEHILPKGINAGNGFPSLAKSWQNFLPSCPRCNSTKNARPTKKDITNAAKAAGFNFTKDDGNPLNLGLAGNDTKVTDREFGRLVKTFYQLPLQEQSFLETGMVLYNINGGAGGIGIEEVTPITGQRTWTIDSINEKEKYVVVQQGIGGPKINYRVFVDDGNYGAAPALGGVPIGGLMRSAAGAVEKVKKMSKICGLNKYDSNTDRRVTERTEAWFMALEAVNRLDNALNDINAVVVAAAAPAAPTPAVIAAAKDEVYKLWKKNVILTMKEKGFFTIWLKIFKEFNNPTGANTLAADIKTILTPSRYFAGTDYTHIP